MKCTNCAHHNSADARFCENCGQPLERVCPNCGQSISGSPRFCKHCGHNLEQAGQAGGSDPTSRSRSLGELRRATPQEMANRIKAESGRLKGERKLVTAVFVDIVGSTALAATMDPEEWRQIVSQSHERVSQAIYEFEGTIAQLLGDGVLAFFGAPLAHEDDPERAIRAALRIRSAAERYAQVLRNSDRVEDFQVRIGVNTGLVVVGNIGHDLHMEYLAIGDTVNLAARLQTAAEPGAILVSDRTQRLAGPVFDYKDLGEIEIKGRSEPLRVFRVLGEREGAARARGVSGLVSPLVGREREFSTLMQRTQDMMNGDGSIIAIVAEAGLGKSRLVAEWRARVQSEYADDLSWIEGRCLSFGVSMAHHMSSDVLRGMIGAPAGSSHQETRAVLRSTVDRLLGETADQVYPFLAHLLGLELGEEHEARVKYLEGPALQSRYVSAFADLLNAMTANSPMVLVIEDVHWADPSSVELGLKVLPLVVDKPLIVVLVARPDKVSHGWRLVDQARDIAGAGALEVHLAPLSEQDSQELVGNLLAIEAIPDHARARILAKTEGNPFFVEEVIRMLIDRGVLIQHNERWTLQKEIETIDIPDTLQGVLTARIDRLPERAKRALQVASVIGRQFPADILKDVLGGEARP